MLFKYYVYTLLDPRKFDAPFYVGKGKDNRCYQHLNGTCSGENKFKDKIINAIRKKGLEPKIKFLVENLEEEKAYEIETWYIQLWGRRNIDPGGILTNVCLDRRPPSAKEAGRIYGPLSKETKKKISKSKTGKKMEPWVGEKLSKIRTGKNNPNYGKKASTETRYKIGSAMRGKNHSEETKNKIGKWNQRLYLLIDPDGNELKLSSKELKNFCIDHNWRYDWLGACRRAGKTYKGWLCYQVQIPVNKASRDEPHSLFL